MKYKETTQVPNILFDLHLPNLKESELKILLIIIRQTNGWINKKTGGRKTRDRISHSQFMKKAGLSRRAVSNSIRSLTQKHLIMVTDRPGNDLRDSLDRKGVKYLYYECAMNPVRSCANGKISYAKLKGPKLRRGGMRSIDRLLKVYYNTFKAE